MGMDWQITLLPYGEDLRARRKIFHQQFGQEAMKSYRDHQLSEAQKLLKNLAGHKSSEEWLADIRLFEPPILACQISFVNAYSSYSTGMSVLVC